MNIAVVGAGYVGLVTATCLAEMGHQVCCQDIDARKIEQLLEGQVPIYEPGLADLIGRNRRAHRLQFTTKLAAALEQATMCFIAVGTPPHQDGSADLSQVLGVAEQIAHTMGGDLFVVVKSTVPVGTCDKVGRRMAAILTERPQRFHADVVSNPEFLKEGAAIEDFMRPDRIVVGAQTLPAAQAMQALYEPFVRNGRPVLIMDRCSAEMTKYAANVMLATRISLMNELALICNRVGADIMAVREGIGSDARIGMHFLYPGIGYGGSCFPKDVGALSRMALDADCPADILAAVTRVNRYQKVWLANRIVDHFDGNISERRIALWGLSFKPNTDDMRAAPALSIIKRLTESGAHVVAYDPEAMPRAQAMLADQPRITFASDAYAAAAGADAIALVTEWPEFRNPDFQRLKNMMKTPLLFDGRNLFKPAEVQKAGFVYVCVGRPRGEGMGLFS